MLVLESLFVLSQFLPAVLLIASKFVRYKHRKKVISFKSKETSLWRNNQHLCHIKTDLINDKFADTMIKAAQID